MNDTTPAALPEQPVDPPADPPHLSWAAWAERHTLLLVLAVALLHGLLYLLLVPPWQHYDEPSHFEYAWLIANRDYLGNESVRDREQRRVILASMIEHHFFRDQSPPNVNADRVRIGFPAFGHPPTYYALASVPLVLLQGQDVVTQLYGARFVSLLLFLLTAALAVGVLRDLAPPGNALRWLVPLTLVLLPPFADVMTAVNSEVGAACVGVLWLWGVVRLLSARPGWLALLWVLAAAGLALATKNTVALLALLTPLVLLVALWQWRGWRWRWLLASLGGGGLVLLIALLGTGDSAAWYRWAGASQQAAGTRVATSAAPHGAHALVLEAARRHEQRQLINPLLEAQATALAGQTVTLGGWVWAERPLRVAGPGIVTSTQPADPFMRAEVMPQQVGTTPQFVAWTFDVPADTRVVGYVFAAAPPRIEGPPTRVYLDGAVLVAGDFATDTPPSFDDASARTGTWGGQPFTNLLRNPSAEASWLRLQPWVGTTLGQVVSFGWGRTPAQLVATLQDPTRTGDILARYVGTLPLDGLVSGLAWGHIRLPGDALVILWRVLVAVGLLGCGWWLLRHARSERGRTLLPLVAVVGLAVLLVWASTVSRALPQLSEGLVRPVARYTFPALLPLLLAVVGGWWALWPVRARRVLLAGWLGWLLVLAAVSLWQVWAFYAVVPAAA